MDTRRKEDAMITIENILVPTDFSKFSKYALNYAIAFAQTFKARIILIHITLGTWRQSDKPLFICRERM
jgi:nucleotide-binding universal stress UspA family protein